MEKTESGRPRSSSQTQERVDVMMIIRTWTTTWDERTTKTTKTREFEVDDENSFMTLLDTPSSSNASISESPGIPPCEEGGVTTAYGCGGETFLVPTIVDKTKVKLSACELSKGDAIGVVGDVLCYMLGVRPETTEHDTVRTDASAWFDRSTYDILKNRLDAMMHPNCPETFLRTLFNLLDPVDVGVVTNDKGDFVFDAFRHRKVAASTIFNVPRKLPLPNDPEFTFPMDRQTKSFVVGIFFFHFVAWYTKTGIPVSLARKRVCACLLRAAMLYVSSDINDISMRDLLRPTLRDVLDRLPPCPSETIDQIYVFVLTVSSFVLKYLLRRDGTLPDACGRPKRTTTTKHMPKNTAMRHLVPKMPKTFNGNVLKFGETGLFPAYLLAMSEAAVWKPENAKRMCAVDHLLRTVKNLEIVFAKPQKATNTLKRLLRTKYDGDVKKMAKDVDVDEEWLKETLQLKLKKRKRGRVRGVYRAIEDVFSPYETFTRVLIENPLERVKSYATLLYSKEETQRLLRRDAIRADENGRLHFFDTTHPTSSIWDALNL